MPPILLSRERALRLEAEYWSLKARTSRGTGPGVRLSAMCLPKHLVAWSPRGTVQLDDQIPRELSAERVCRFDNARHGVMNKSTLHENVSSCSVSFTALALGKRKLAGHPDRRATGKGLSREPVARLSPGYPTLTGIIRLRQRIGFG